MVKGSSPPDRLARDRRWLRKLAQDLTRDPALAEDLVQDAMLIALERPRDAQGPLRPWLAGVVRNLHRMWIRGDVRRRRRELGNDPTTDAVVSGPDRALEEATAARILRDEVQRLSEPYRTTLLLRYYEGLPAEDIARRLGIPPATVRKRSQLALQRLRRRLDDRRGRPTWTRALLGLFGWRDPERPALAAWRARLRRAAVVSVVGAAALLPSLALELTGRGDRRSLADSEDRAGALPRFTAEGNDPGALPGHTIDVGAGEASSAATAAPAKGEHDGGCPRLETLIKEARPGDRVEVPPCVYREQVTIDRPLKLIARPGAELRGSDVWSRFERTAEGWDSADRVPPMEERRAGCGTVTAGRCIGAEQVFVDGRALDRIADARPAAGQFTVLPDRRVRLGDDPGGHTVEVTTRERWIRVSASDVEIRGFRMRHASAADGALYLGQSRARIHVVDNVMSETSGPIMLIGGTDQLVARNVLRDAATEAVKLLPGRGSVLRDNEITSSGRPYLGEKWYWRGGGIAGVGFAGRIERNRIHDNRGSGVFLIKGTEQTVVANDVHDNWGTGIILLAGRGNLIEGNRLWRNGWRATPHEPAMFVSDTRDAEIRGNTLAFHPFGIRVNTAKGSALPASFTPCEVLGGNWIASNVLIASGDERTAVSFLGDPRFENPHLHCASNRSEGNRLWAPRPTSGYLPLTDDETQAIIATLR